MKHPDSRAGLARYDLTRSPDGIDTPTFPAEPGRAHAVTMDSMYTDLDRRYGKIPRTLDTVPGTDFDWEYTAECGRTVKVLLTIPFNDTDPDACPACVELMSAKSRSINEYRQLREDRHERQTKRMRREWALRQAMEEERLRRMFEQDN